MFIQQATTHDTAMPPHDLGEILRQGRAIIQQMIDVERERVMLRRQIGNLQADPSRMTAGAIEALQDKAIARNSEFHNLAHELDIWRGTYTAHLDVENAEGGAA
jgi:hypothetical protein